MSRGWYDDPPQTSPYKVPREPFACAALKASVSPHVVTLAIEPAFYTIAVTYALPSLQMAAGSEEGR